MPCVLDNAIKPQPIQINGEHTQDTMVHQSVLQILYGRHAFIIKQCTFKAA